MHLYCPTDLVVLLVGFASPKGIIVFPSEHDALPGIHFSNKALSPIDVQLCVEIERICAKKLLAKDVHIEQAFAEKISHNGQDASLYLALVKDEQIKIPETSLPLMLLLRAMPKNHNRLAYLKALQVLTGSLQLVTKVVEI